MKYCLKSNPKYYSATPTPQKSMGDNFASSLKLLSTPFNDISSAHSLSMSSKGCYQSVKEERKDDDDIRPLPKPQLTDEENEWESLVILSDDAAAYATHPKNLKNERNVTTQSKCLTNGIAIEEDSKEDEIERVDMPLKCEEDLKLKKDAGSIDVDDQNDEMEASGTLPNLTVVVTHIDFCELFFSYQCNYYYSIGSSSAHTGSLTDDTVVDVAVIPVLQGCDTSVPCDDGGNNGTSETKGNGGARTTTRRRRRVSGGLGLISAYSSQANEPKFRYVYMCSSMIWLT